MATRKKDMTADAPPVVPQADMEARLVRHDPPTPVGSVTAAEAYEIKQRNALIERVHLDAEHHRRVAQVVGNEKGAFMRSIGARLGVKDTEEFNVNDDTGLVTVTAHVEYVPATPAAPVEEESALHALPDAEPE